MTDKQFIETLRNIQDYCRLTTCTACKLSYNSDRLCILQAIIRQLDMCPECWDIDKIERLLKDE